jgi:ribosomal-protein-alanine N-acetyltransferase
MKYELRQINGNEQPNSDYPDGYNQTIEIYGNYYQEHGFHIPWVAYFVFGIGKPMGTCGFTAAPTGKRVEIAYWTYKEFEGRGVASFACRALIEIANTEDPSVIVYAKTEPQKNHSTLILERNGFVLICSVTDNDIGEAWMWERVVPN